MTKLATSLGFHHVHSIEVHPARLYRRSDGKHFYASEIVLIDNEGNRTMIDLFGDTEFAIKVREE